jgi:hypothetical protein
VLISALPYGNPGQPPEQGDLRQPSVLHHGVHAMETRGVGLSVNLDHAVVDVVLKSLDGARCRVVPVEPAEGRCLKESSALTSQMLAMVRMSENVVGGCKRNFGGLAIDLPELVNIRDLLNLDNVRCDAGRRLVGDQT